eukprot:4509454-Amphidinium_carterae.1
MEARSDLPNEPLFCNSRVLTPSQHPMTDMDALKGDNQYLSESVGRVPQGLAGNVSVWISACKALSLGATDGEGWWQGVSTSLHTTAGYSWIYTVSTLWSAFLLWCASHGNTDISPEMHEAQLTSHTFFGNVAIAATATAQ